MSAGDETAPVGAAPGRVSSAFRSFARSRFSSLPAPLRRTMLHARGRYAPWEDGFDFTPPRPGRAEVIGAPDFVGIGVQKAGTTWWFRLVTSHPLVAHRDDIHKERHFFDRFAARAFGVEEVRRYHGWFPRPVGTVTGEWTPDYLHLSWVPPLLAEAAPDAKLLVLVRDPVERFRSGLSHHREHRGALTAEAYADALARGFYDHALGQWERVFPREQILVLQYERCVRDPMGELQKTYRFLGLPYFEPRELEARVNGGREQTMLSDDALRRLRDVYAPDVQALVDRIPEVDLALWANFCGSARACKW